VTAVAETAAEVADPLRRAPFQCTQPEVKEVRSALEPEVAALAAARATEEHVLARERACAVLEQATAEHRSLVNPSIALRVAIAEGSYTPVFVRAVRNIHALWEKAEPMVIFPQDRATDNRQHRTRVAAIRQRNPDAVRRLMRRHILEWTSESRL